MVVHLMVVMHGCTSDGESPLSTRAWLGVSVCLSAARFCTHMRRAPRRDSMLRQLCLSALLGKGMFRHILASYRTSSICAPWPSVAAFDSLELYLQANGPPSALSAACRPLEAHHLQSPQHGLAPQVQARPWLCWCLMLHPEPNRGSPIPAKGTVWPDAL